MNAHSTILAGDGDDAFRAAHVGASEVAALFGESPYLTEFELWHRKAGNVATPDFAGNERMEWGIRLEPAIIEAAKDRWGYTDREQIKRLSNGKGLGGHPDRRVTCPERGPGILEVKMVDWLERKKWGDEPPLHYLLQDQSYQGLDGAKWGDVIVLVGGNALERHQYDFRPGLYAEIEKRVEAFWQSVRENKPPKADYTRDVGTMAALYSDATDTVVDLRLDNRMPELLREYLEAKKAETDAGCRVDAAKAEILEKLGTNSAAIVEGFTCRVPVQGGTPGRLITEEDVGTYIGARKPSRRVTVKERE